MITFKRTNSENLDFLNLIKELDLFLDERDKTAHTACKPYNSTESIKYVIVAYNEYEKPVGCGAIREYSQDTMEVKRMYVQKDQRRKNIASKILIALENWAIELGASKCILETGNKMPEAINLYKNNHYIQIPNYGQYQSIESSICLEKILLSH